MEDRERARGYIRERFLQSPHDVSAYEMFDFVVNRRGVSEGAYRQARKDLKLKGYRIGKHYHFPNPYKDNPTKPLEDEIKESLLPLARGVEWSTFLAAAKVALKEVKRVS